MPGNERERGATAAAGRDTPEPGRVYSNCYSGKIDIKIPRLVTIDTGWGIFPSQDKCYVVFSVQVGSPCPVLETRVATRRSDRWSVARQGWAQAGSYGCDQGERGEQA